MRGRYELFGEVDHRMIFFLIKAFIDRLAIEDGTVGGEEYVGRCTVGEELNSLAGGCRYI